MLQSQGLIEIQRARQSPSLGPLGCPRISVCGYILKSGPAHNRLPEADVESSRRLVQETAFWNFGRFFCLFVCACFLILVFAGCTLIFPRCFVCCQKNRILAAGLCPGHLVLCFPLCVLATLPTGNRSRPHNEALLLLF